VMTMGGNARSMVARSGSGRSGDEGVGDGGVGGLEGDDIVRLEGVEKGVVSVRCDGRIPGS
jgi:hypothetical protein